MLYIMKKLIDVDNSDVMYNRTFSEESLKADWKVYGGEWWLEDGWLNGKNPENAPGMIVCKIDFPYNVLVDFEVRTIPPSTHDINFMWNGCWDENKNERGIAYVAGLEGWWQGKVGMEKSPEYKLNVATPLFDFEPGRIYRLQGGSIDGHCFLFVDGELVLEFTDPEPIDFQKFAKVGFEAYSSHIQVRNLKIKKIKWQAVEMTYAPEF